MIALRTLLVIPAMLLLAAPMDADAQGRGRRADPRGANGRADDNGGPAFCRSGVGHPVHGWEWCRARGWDRAGNASRNTSGRTVGRGPAGVAVPRQGNATAGRVRGGNRVNAPGFDNGYSDGYEKGLDDGRDRRAFDPTRHNWYRSADRNYDPSYGSRAAYANVYRDGFRSGYEAGYGDGERYGGTESGTSRFPWPF
jgi:hypothetical protein